MPLWEMHKIFPIYCIMFISRTTSHSSHNRLALMECHHYVFTLWMDQAETVLLHWVANPDLHKSALFWEAGSRSALKWKAGSISGSAWKSKFRSCKGSKTQHYEEPWIRRVSVDSGRRFASLWWGTGSGSGFISGSILKWKVGSGSASKLRRGIRFRIKVMRILNPFPTWNRIKEFWLVPSQAER